MKQGRTSLKWRLGGLLGAPEDLIPGFKKALGVLVADSARSDCDASQHMGGLEGARAGCWVFGVLASRGGMRELSVAEWYS